MIPRLVVTVHFGQAAQTGATSPAAQSAEQAAQSATRAAQNAEQARANADRMIENAIQEAERAANAAGEAAPPPVPPAPGGGPIVFTSDNGRPVSISMDNGNLVLSQEGSTQVIPLRTIIPREAVQLAWAIPATLSVLLIWWPLSRAVIRWLNRKHSADGEMVALESRLRERMESLERNVDTVAIEMERLSEGQRFTNRLLAERQEGVPIAARQDSAQPIGNGRG